MNTDPKAWIELQGVAKSYGRQAVLENASLTIAKGSALAVVGRSGSGKSTLLRLMGGLESADAGTIRIDGTELTALAESERALWRRSDLGFVFQSFNLIPTLTATENVELPLALNGVSPDATRRRAHDLLAELGIEHGADRFPEDLSGGEQQRVAIARAVVHEPKLVLADEPTGNLDAETAHHVLALLRRTCRDRSATLIVATHSNEVAAQTERVVSILNGGVEDTAM
jgi:putative ABC transport system ATP-binding protein